MHLWEIETQLYWHGSDVKGLKTLEPQESELVGRKVVFAATYPEIAVAMSGHWNDIDFNFGRTMKQTDDPGEVPYTLREKREGAFEEFFSDPISLYEVDGKWFRSDPEIQDFEVVSNRAVKILDEHRIEHPLDYLHKSRMVILKSKS